MCHAFRKFLDMVKKIMRPTGNAFNIFINTFHKKIDSISSLYIHVINSKIYCTTCQKQHLKCLHPTYAAYIVIVKCLQYSSLDIFSSIQTFSIMHTRFIADPISTWSSPLPSINASGTTTWTFTKCEMTPVDVDTWKEK